MLTSSVALNLVGLPCAVGLELSLANSNPIVLLKGHPVSSLVKHRCLDFSSVVLDTSVKVILTSPCCLLSSFAGLTSP